MTTTWGAQIEAGSVGYPIAGQRPDWLANTDMVRDIDPGSITDKEPRQAGMWGWYGIKAFQLPSDHWAYRPIEAGFTPWAGGPSAPNDWDRGELMLIGGQIVQSKDYFRLRWTHGQTIKVGDQRDIIGYKRKEMAAYSPAKPQTDMRGDVIDPVKQSARTLLEALASRTGATIVPRDDTLGIISQISAQTELLAVQRHAEHVADMVELIERMGERYRTGTARNDLYPFVMEDYGRARDIQRKLAPSDPIKQAVDDYIAQYRPATTDRTAIASVIRFMESRK